ncbi:MAG: DUF5703 domain-containing protein [Tannerella sp.]|nr:DUF5703 domain-containing protein [Tannerella sp.]
MRDAPGENSFGSMPPGNGEVGLNVWCEKKRLALYGL